MNYFALWTEKMPYFFSFELVVKCAHSGLCDRHSKPQLSIVLEEKPPLLVIYTENPNADHRARAVKSGFNGDKREQQKALKRREYLRPYTVRVQTKITHKAEKIMFNVTT